MSLQEIEVQVEKIDSIFVMRLEGAISSFTYKKFIEEVRKCNRKGGLIIDMEEVTAISSMGIAALKEISDMSYKSGNKIVFLNLSINVKQSLQMVGLSKVFNVAPNEELAMKMASKPSR
ncbi:MAG: STAS domain-containing protein [Leptospiraceae bacterium]|nr:STAS domain-containing protein [Leptospiraceae bacterium]